jgi:exonuclease SbcC
MQNTIKLRLKNFRRLAHTEDIIFRPGLTVISGPNGAGKTTLTESLIYALFGPSLKKGKGLPDILTDNAVGTTLVECELIIDQQLVKIVRTGKVAELWVNNTQIVQAIPSSAKIVNREIQRMLGGLDRTQFERVYVALQGDTAGLVDEDPRKRYDIIERVLQLDVLGKALELQKDRRSEASGIVLGEGNTACQNLHLDDSARSLLAQFRAALKLQNRIEHAQKFLLRIDQALKDYQINRDGVQRQLNETNDRVKALAKMVEEQDAICKAKKQKNDSLDQLQTQYQGVTTRIAKLDGQLTELQADIDQYEAAITRAEQYAEAAQEYQRLSGSISAKDLRLQQLPLVKNCFQLLTRSKDKEADLNRRLLAFVRADEELLNAQQKESSAKQRRDILFQDDPLYEKELQSWLQADALLKQMEQQNSEALELLETNSSDATCPTCNQHFTEHTPEQRMQHLQHWLQYELPQQRTRLNIQKARLDQRAEQRKQDRDAAEQAYLDSQNALADCKSAIKERNLIRAQYNTAQKESEQAQKVWSDLNEASDYNPSEEASIKEELIKLRQDAEKVANKAQQYDQLPLLKRTVEEKRKTREGYMLDRAKLVREQTELGYQPEQHQAIKEEIQIVQDRLSELREQQIKAQQALEEAKAKYQLAKQAVTTAIDHYDRFETSVQEYYKEDRLYTLLDEFKKHFFEANTREVFARTTQLLQHAITDQSLLGIQFEGQQLSYLDASGVTRPISRLSGGEKSLVGLCLRIALAEQAQAITRTGKVSFLILDEVLSSLDDERCSAVQRIFEDVQQRGIFEHILMVTHLDSVKQGWRAAGLEVRKKDTKTSEVIPVAPGAFSAKQAEEIEV